MLKTPQEVRMLTHELMSSAWTLAAIGALFESGLADSLREPRSLDDLAARCPSLGRGRIERCLAVVSAAGLVVVDGATYRLADGAMPFSQPPMRAAMQGDVRTHLMQPLAFLDSATNPQASEGWKHTNAALLQAQGDASAAFPPMFKANAVASMGDLATRLDQPGARFLDVGVGVAALSIAMCRVFPAVAAVGLDVFDVPLAIARENVARAGLADRIELRQLAVEELREEEAFELAWLPSFFVPAPSLASAVKRVHAALKPGGWLLFPASVNPAADERTRAVSGLLSELWGGATISAAEAESVLKDAGFATVRTMPGPPWAPAMMMAQR